VQDVLQSVQRDKASDIEEATNAKREVKRLRMEGELLISNSFKLIPKLGTADVWRSKLKTHRKAFIAKQ
jgi:hypothetical protein